MSNRSRVSRADYYRHQAQRVCELALTARKVSNEILFRDLAAQYEELARMVDDGVLKP